MSVEKDRCAADEEKAEQEQKEPKQTARARHEVDEVELHAACDEEQGNEKSGAHRAQLALERLRRRVANEGGDDDASRVSAERDLHAELARERDETEQRHDRYPQRQSRGVAHRSGDDERQAVRTRALRQPCRAESRQ